MNSLFRKEVKEFNSYIPGRSIEEVKQKYGIGEVIKLASNENPLGPSPMAMEAARNALCQTNRYPDPLSTKLRISLAKELGVEKEQVVVGNGAEQILLLIADTFVDTGDEAVMADPSFDIYAQSVQFLGGNAVKVPLNYHEYDLDKIADAINERTKLVCLCNPNNPTGNIITKNKLNYFLKHIPEKTVIVLDEAYYEYACIHQDYPNGLEILKDRENTIIVRTFSKIAGLAGLRIGFAVSSEAIIEAMLKIKQTFNVGSISQEAALGGIKDKAHIRKTVELNNASMRRMETGFDEMGLDYIKSYTNFIFVDMGKDSQDIYEQLMSRGFIVKPGAIWGYKSWIRVSTGTLDQTEKFIGTLKKIL